MKKIEYDLSDIDMVAKKLNQEIAGCRVITLSGSLGAGKTTLTGALLRQLGVQVPVVSPTFTYVNQYQTAQGCMVYHFDLYRLQSAQEFEQAGFFEYLYQPDSVAVIEWPEILMPKLTKNACHIQISAIDQTHRLITYQKFKE